jgi:hypothetical protein
MLRLNKDHAVLYVGTTESAAKLAPVMGVNPNNKPVHLTDVYPGLFAFQASGRTHDRFGILEIVTSFLDISNLLPCSWYVEQTSRHKVKNGKNGKAPPRRKETIRKALEKRRAKWKDSLMKIGVCLYDGFIPKKAIRKITIYDPASNTVITEAISGAHLHVGVHKKCYRRNLAVRHWLSGEHVSVEDWLGEELLDTPKDQREQLAEQLQNKLGLDIFYHEPAPK